DSSSVRARARRAAARGSWVIENEPWLAPISGPGAPVESLTAILKLNVPICTPGLAVDCHAAPCWLRRGFDTGRNTLMMSLWHLAPLLQRKSLNVLGSITTTRVHHAAWRRGGMAARGARAAAGDAGDRVSRRRHTRQESEQRSR